MGRVSHSQGEKPAVSGANLEGSHLMAAGRRTRIIGNQKIAQAMAFLLAGWLIGLCRLAAISSHEAVSKFANACAIGNGGVTGSQTNPTGLLITGLVS